jgi:hypothetical protein
MKTIRLVSVLLGLGVALLLAMNAGTTSNAQEKVVPVTKWEYKIIHSYPSENDFNAYGAQGWELSGVVGHLPDFSPPVTFIFKRPKL